MAFGRVHAPAPEEPPLAAGSDCVVPLSDVRGMSLVEYAAGLARAAGARLLVVLAWPGPLSVAWHPLSALPGPGSEQAADFALDFEIYLAQTLDPGGTPWRAVLWHPNHGLPAGLLSRAGCVLGGPTGGLPWLTDRRAVRLSRRLSRDHGLPLLVAPRRPAYFH